MSIFVLCKINPYLTFIQLSSIVIRYSDVIVVRPSSVSSDQWSLATERQGDGPQYMTGFRADCAFDAIQNIFPQVIL